ncbi:MAG: diadenylate cyclase CdaA [Chloroflexi bacterium]|nr:diadenylate cyclase CdaA [Chloroflexota bacterium]
MRDEISDVLGRIDVAALVDMAILFAAIYWALLLIRGTTAMSVLRGVGVLLIGAFALSRLFDLVAINWILSNAVTGLLIAMVVIFQPEIRRALEQLGRTGLRSPLRAHQRRDVLDIVVRGTSQLTRQRRGALIVLERETGLQDVIDTGIPVDATLSAEMLLSVFLSSSPLHDGAVLVQGDRIVAAGCTLPLSEATLPPEYGLRHRAAIGLTERTDAVVVVVSEERGVMALSAGGRITPPLDEGRMSRQLRRLFGVPADEDLEPLSAGAPQGPGRRGS